MAHSSRAADILSSPSFNDTEAASQQLLAEASSPVRRQPAAAASANAVIGASLLNHARTLTKPPAMAPSASEGKVGKLPKLGQLKPGQLGPGRSAKPGKLARASLSSLVSDGKPKVVRGDKMYEIDPSPQKRRPHSSPLHAAALEDEDRGQLENAQEDEHMVPKTTQVQAEDDAPVKTLGGGHPTAMGEDLIRVVTIENVSVSPGTPPHAESTAVPEKRPRKLQKSGENTTSAPSSAIISAEAYSVLAEDIQDDVLPSSPPVLPLQEVSSTSKKPRRRERKSGESAVPARISDFEQLARQEKTEPAIVSTKLKRKTRLGEKHNSDTNGEFTKSPSTKKQRRLNGPAMVSPDTARFDEDIDAPTTTAPFDARSNGDLQHEVRIPIRSTRSRTAKAEAELANTQEHSATAIPAAATGRKAKPVSRAARSTRPTKPAFAPEAFKRKSSASVQESESEVAQADRHVSETMEESLEAEFELAIDQGQIGHPQSDAMSEANAKYDGHDVEPAKDEEQPGESQNNQDDGGNEHVGEHGDQDDDDTAEGANSAGAGQIVKDAVSRLPILAKVFDFIDSEGRSGVCSTKLGRSIHRMCDRSRVVLSRSGEDCSLEEITRCKDDLVALLRSIGVNVHGGRRIAFKRDAFAYLFRALTLVLEAMHDKLQEKEGDITESLDAMQIVHPYICELLLFKDTMDSWKVVVQQLTKGDRLIKGVEIDLIAPLRAIEKEFRVHLRRLQKVKQSRQTLVATQRRREEEEQELIEREEALRYVRERRKRWQDLHIVRMQCEPDPSRRRRLRFVEPIQAEETDANGRPFERVPFFGERSAPPPQWTAASSGREWTKEQETVLLDALQSSATLDCIFKTYCDPTGALRDFSVSDFAAKLVWVRSGWAQLSHQHGWDVPDWVKKIPVLP